MKQEKSEKNLHKVKVKVIGTSHVSKKSANQVKAMIEEWKPEIIAIELDEKRLINLMSKKKKKKKMSIKELGVTTFIFLKLAAYMQKKIGSKLNTTPGSEMKTAIKLAKEKKLPLFLIDQDMKTTSQKLSKNFTLKEKIKIVKEIFLGPLSLLPSRKRKEIKNMKKLLTGDVPSEKTLEELINYFKKSYPGIYSVLVEERNQIMSENIIKITKIYEDKKILAIVGAGHKKGIEKILRNKNII